MVCFSLSKIQFLMVIILAFKSVSLFSDDFDTARVKIDALNLYASIQHLKRDAETVLKPIHIYVGSQTDAFVVQAAKIQIDDNAPVRYVYSEMESHVLLEGGLHEIGRFNLPAGDHRIRAEIVALASNAGPSTKRIFPSIDQYVKVDDEIHIELSLLSDGLKKMLGGAELVVSDWRPSL
tara:strand:- start:10901 stop:11437 length:537 start_codon:yes stop_codon:yes gene_type:complete